MIDDLFLKVRKHFESLTDSRRQSEGNIKYSLADYLSIGFAMFSLKDSSYSIFKGKYDQRSENLKRVYYINDLPGDTAFRSGLDKLETSELNDIFREPLEELASKGAFKNRLVLQGRLAISYDASGTYSSSKHQCPQCLVKKYRNGKETYYHQCLAGVNVCPDQKTVFPIGIEAIVQQDGLVKNDCELNSIKRLLPRTVDSIKALGIDNKILGIFDALYASLPHINLVESHNMDYIIGVKKGHIQDQIKKLKETNSLSVFSWTEKGKIHTISYINSIELNASNKDKKVNYCEYSIVDKKTQKSIFYGTWITNVHLTKSIVKEFVKVARSRWKIENETFNTLKNQGYHLEHNYGHGKKHLMTNFAILTFLAFLVDQIAQHLDPLFQKAWLKEKTKKAFWMRIREVFNLLPVNSMSGIYKFIIIGKNPQYPLIE